MSKSSSHAPSERFHFPNSPALWHDKGQPRSLGCQACPHLALCGGINVEQIAYDCLSFCRCSDPASCDNVCPNNLDHMVARLMEVQGFDLSNVPSAPPLETPLLPPIVPLLYHCGGRVRAPTVSTVALSLYGVIGKRNNRIPFATRHDLLEHFKLAADTTIVLSGTHDDRPLERLWSIANPQEVMHAVRELGVRLITTPNFSLFDDVPRHDNLFNMKRIARVWSEIQNAGIPCALHLNARTDRDWERWTTFLKDHPEIAFVAFEFGTGAGAASRTAWYVDQLRRLAGEVARPLNLVMRGGLGDLRGLAAAFSRVTVIETSAFVRAQNRRRITLKDGKLGWTSSPTLPGVPIDDLLDANISTLEEYAARTVAPVDAPSDAVNAESAAA